MAIEEIIRKIELETEEKTKQILTSAKEEEKNILEKARAEADKIKEQMLKIRKGEIQENKRREITLADLEARKTVLAEKQKIVSEVYARVLERLENLEPREFRELMKKLILTIASGGEELIIAQKDKHKISPESIKEINQILAKQKKEPIRLSEEVHNVPGGFILRKGNLEINISFPALVKSLREKTELEVIKLLF